MPNGYISYSLVKYLDKDTPEYVPTNNSGTRFKVSFGSEDDAEVIEKGIKTYNEAYVPEYENAGFYKADSFENELQRVMVHGLLHLIGYDDHTPEQQKVMREKENYYLDFRAKMFPVR